MDLLIDGNGINAWYKKLKRPNSDFWVSPLSANSLIGSHFYFIGASILVLCWMILYLFLRHSRTAMFWTGLIMAPAGPICEYWHHLDYWRPVYLIEFVIGDWHFGFEDGLVAFALTGIAAGLYEHLHHRRGFASIGPASLKTLTLLSGWGILACFTWLVLMLVLGMNSTNAISLTMAVLSLIMARQQLNSIPALLGVALLLGAGSLLLYAGILIPISPGLIHNSWNLQALSGVMLIGVPLEEILWFAAVGLFAGPVYRVSSMKSR